MYGDCPNIYCNHIKYVGNWHNNLYFTQIWTIIRIIKWINILLYYKIKWYKTWR